MTALKKTVRTRRGVEPTGRPARREVELGKRSTNELVQDVRAESWSAALAGCAAGRCHRRGTCAGRDEARSWNSGTPAPRRRRRQSVVVRDSSYLEHQRGEEEKGEGKRSGRLRPQRAVMYHQGCSSSSSASFGLLTTP